MAVVEIIPMDEASMLPLPIYPVMVPGRSDWHHSFYERNDPRLQGLGGKAVRHCRMQYIARALHDSYHDFYRHAYRPLPTDTMSQFYTVVMAASHYLPRVAVDVSGTEPVLRKLDDITHRRIRSRELSFQPRTEWGIGMFLMGVVLSQQFDHIHEQTIEEFLDTYDDKRRRALGHFIIAQAVERGVEPIDPVYRRAWKSGLIPPTQPDEPVAHVQRLFAGHIPDYFDLLQDRLLQTTAS